MLDTNICIYILNKRPIQVLEKLSSLVDAKVFLSSIVVAELQYGAVKSGSPEKNLARLQEFLNDFLLEPFGIEVGMQAGVICSNLETLGTPIGDFDYLIAAHALELGATLVTNNLEELKA